MGYSMFILSYEYEEKLPLRSPALQNSNPDMSTAAQFSRSKSAEHTRMTEHR